MSAIDDLTAACQAYLNETKTLFNMLADQRTINDRLRLAIAEVDNRVTVLEGGITPPAVDGIPSDVYIPGLAAAATPTGIGSYPAQNTPFTDASGLTIERWSAPSAITTGNGFSAAQAAAPKTFGLRYPKRYQDTADGQYVACDQVGDFGAGQGSSDRWALFVLATKALVTPAALVPVPEAFLAFNVATPLRQYFTAFNSAGTPRVTQWRRRELPSGSSDNLIADFQTTYNFIGTEGEGRQDHSDGRIALLANRSDNTGMDILVINVTTGAVVSTIALSGYASSHGSALSGITRNLDYVTISHDGLWVYLGVISGNAGGGFAGCTNAVAIFNATTGAYVRKTPDWRFSHGDAGVNSAGLQGWIGQDAAGSYAQKSVRFFGVDGSDVEMLAAGPMVSQAYISGLTAGRAFIGCSIQTARDSSDLTAQAYCRLIDLKLDGSQTGNVRFTLLKETAAGVEDAMFRFSQDRSRKKVFLHAQNTDANRVDFWVSTYAGATGGGGGSTTVLNRADSRVQVWIDPTIPFANYLAEVGVQSLKGTYSNVNRTPTTSGLLTGGGTLTGYGGGNAIMNQLSESLQGKHDDTGLAVFSKVADSVNSGRVAFRHACDATSFASDPGPNGASGGGNGSYDANIRRADFTTYMGSSQNLYSVPRDVEFYDGFAFKFSTEMGSYSNQFPIWEHHTNGGAVNGIAPFSMWYGPSGLQVVRRIPSDNSNAAPYIVEASSALNTASWHYVVVTGTLSANTSVAKLKFYLAIGESASATLIYETPDGQPNIRIGDPGPKQHRELGLYLLSGAPAAEMRLHTKGYIGARGGAGNVGEPTMSVALVLATMRTI